MTKIYIKTVRPMIFEEKFLIVALEISWLTLFKDIAFDVSVVNGFLRIQSTEAIRK
jgi:hypothetical protein